MAADRVRAVAGSRGIILPLTEVRQKNEALDAGVQGF